VQVTQCAPRQLDGSRRYNGVEHLIRFHHAIVAKPMRESVRNGGEGVVLVPYINSFAAEYTSFSLS
jgi:hypothetical protein